MRYHLKLIRMATVQNKNQNPENNKCWWRCGETGTLVHCWWECKIVQPLWKTVVSQKIKHRTIIWSSNSASGYIPKIIDSKISKSYLYTMFIVALFTVAKTWKPPKGALTDELISKIWYIHIKEYYSALKRKEILTYATTWMNFEDIMWKWNKPAPKRQILYDSTYMRYLQVVKIIEMESWMVVARAWWEGDRGSCLMGLVSQGEKNSGDAWW